MATTPVADPQLQVQAKAALAKLADVVAPPPVAWWPQTWGWAVVAILLLALIFWAVVHAIRRHHANRYRRVALAELAQIECLLADAATRGSALVAMPALIKRSALAAWPREQVAALSGKSWSAFVTTQSGVAADPALARLLDDLEYRGDAVLAAISVDDARAMLHGTRRWITAHRAPKSRKRQAHVPA